MCCYMLTNNNQPKLSMTNLVSPWAAAAADELLDLKSISLHDYQGYRFEVYQTLDSLWMTATFPKGSKIAFRMGCIPGDQLSLKRIVEKEEKCQFILTTPRGDLRVDVQFPTASAPVLRYTTRFKAKTSFLVPFWPKDILTLTSKGKFQQHGKIHAHQIGTRSGLLHFSITAPKTGSVFYFQKLSSLNPYFESTKTSAAETVGGNLPELGFSLPPTAEDPVPADKEIVISDAVVAFSPEVPESDLQITQQFIEFLALVYQFLDRPAVKYQDWLQIGRDGLDGISNHKGCWTFAGGHPYLNAYLADYKTPAEIMVQLSVLVPLLEYCTWSSGHHKIIDELRDGLPPFYDEKLGTVVRWLPALKDNLDNSEEQKRDRIMDSWYLHHPLTNLARMAQSGDKVAKELVLKSIDFAINVAHHFDYDWPVFYRMDTLEVTKAETQPGKGGEKDVPGSYAKLMLEMWKLTKEQRYLTEAKKAVKKLKGLGFDIFYQANNTAFSAVALLRLYKLTKQQWYLDLSYCCIASILKNTQLWDCNYGNGKFFPSFFSVFPLNDAPYTAAYEEQEVYSTLYGYLQEAADIEILPSIKLLIGEFVRYAITRMPFYFPPMLPKEMLSEEVKTGEIDPNLWIPLEDIHDGWERSGGVGQEVYGACASFGIIPRQYFKVPDQDFMVYVDYPSMDFKPVGKNAISMRILGDQRMSCTLIIILKKGIKKKDFKLQVAATEKKKYQEVKPIKTSAQQIEFNINADQVLKLQW
jgi:hypothetical protein